MPKEPLTIFNVDNKVTNKAENYLACMLLHTYSNEFSIYYEGFKLVSPKNHKHTLVDLSLIPQASNNHINEVHIEVTQSNNLDQVRKSKQRHIAFDYIKANKGVEYVQICRQLLYPEPNLALTIIDQLAHGVINSEAAHNRISRYIDNNQKSTIELALFI
jgi:hypothetical protein